MNRKEAIKEAGGLVPVLGIMPIPATWRLPCRIGTLAKVEAQKCRSGLIAIGAANLLHYPQDVIDAIEVFPEDPGGQKGAHKILARAFDVGYRKMFDEAVNGSPETVPVVHAIIQAERAYTRAATHKSPNDVGWFHTTCWRALRGSFPYLKKVTNDPPGLNTVCRGCRCLLVDAVAVGV